MRQKIRELQVGQGYTSSFLVKYSQIKTTKAKKPYLFLELSDGMDSVTANVWDWISPNKPEKGSIVDMEGTVTEYNGNKQLKVDLIQQNKTMNVAEFAPKSALNIDEYVQKTSALIQTITHSTTRELIHTVFKDYSELWKTIPGAKSIHHAYVAGTLKHSVDTAIKAKVLAENIEMCNVDLCIAGGLVHDLGKLWAYEFKGALINMSEVGESLDHIIIGVNVLERYRNDSNTKVVDLLQHIIASHHGKLEFGSPVTPRFLEAWVVSCADGIDAKADTIKQLNEKSKTTDKYTDKEWTLENKAMFTQYYIADIMMEDV
jgi:3'-5' exoribonuclease